MAGAILEKRELYIDVEVKENQVEELLLYQVDFNKDRSFQTKEYVYTRVEQTEGEDVLPEPLEAWKNQWGILCKEDIATEVYATDAMRVINYVLEPLKKKYPEFQLAPKNLSGRELLHDCISMGRVISMSVFDEEEYLSAGIRRRMKERYHEHVDEVKAERAAHLFLRQGETSLDLFVTDAGYTLKKKVTLLKRMQEEAVAMRLREMLSVYPAADIIVDEITPEIYRLFHNINLYMEVEKTRMLFSMESMLCALGKKPENEDMIHTYLMYIKNPEDMRHGRFLPERLYSTHSFYLPVQISGEKAWKKQFKKNSLWKQVGRECYQINMEEDLKGKYIVKAGREQFSLRLRRISLQRYLKKYAVLRLDMDNFCYPGILDRERINELASCIFYSSSNPVDRVELKLKDGTQAQTLTTVPLDENEQGELWLNGLLLLGKKNKKQKNGLSMTSLKESMYCTENEMIPEEEVLVQAALVRDGVFRRLEDALAKVMKPEKSDRPAGKVSRHQKKEIRELYELYRYLVVSFGEGYEASQKECQAELWRKTEQRLVTTAVEERLKKKFDMFF